MTESAQRDALLDLSYVSDTVEFLGGCNATITPILILLRLVYNIGLNAQP